MPKQTPDEAVAELAEAEAAAAAAAEVAAVEAEPVVVVDEAQTPDVPQVGDIAVDDPNPVDINDFRLGQEAPYSVVGVFVGAPTESNLRLARALAPGERGFRLVVKGDKVTRLIARRLGLPI